MSEELGISRTPIREALARLEQEGFVDVRPRKGVYIKRKSLDEILEMIVVWAALESMAARLATAHASDEEIRSLRKMVAEFSKNDADAHLDEYSEANIQFHQRILEISKCRMLKDIADGLFLHMRSIRNRAMAEADRVKRSLVDHIHIIEAIEDRDADLAGELVREHTMRLHAHVRRTWKEFVGVSAAEKAASLADLPVRGGARAVEQEV
jgi:DNA-binding GntR family transcriptional regulator